MTRDNEPGGWTNDRTAFAAFMMSTTGIWWILSGLAAVLISEFYVGTFITIFEFDISTWGWAQLIAGIIVLLAGIFLFRGGDWAWTFADQGAVLPVPSEGARGDSLPGKPK
jgi:hypothetical protein